MSVIGDDPDQGRLVDRFAAVCTAAAERGIQPCLEFFVYSQVQTLAVALRILDRAAQPGAALLIDPLHIQRSGGTAAVLAAVPAHRLPYLQLCDAPLLPIWPDPTAARVESRTDRLLPGDGELPLLDLLAAMPLDAALSAETPVARLAHLPVAERARLAFAAMSRLLEAANRQAGTSARTQGVM